MTAIVFDLDGTLIDSLPDIHVALNKVLAGEGARPVTEAETRGFIGHGIPNLVAQARHARGLDLDRQHAMTEAMMAHYLAHPADLTRPYPGAVAALNALRDLGHPLGLCTNKALKPTLDILDALNLRSHFAEVIGGDSLPQKKPDPAPLHACFAGLGAPLLYVGDSEVDAETAQRAGIRFALYTQGYRKAPVADLPHDLAFADYADLVAWVAARA
ncbi:phosphoglycolate phosphatase [Rhodobacter sp. KR11]|uniref:phosphoglycolate phosphatase n=1 Tax=Rhodobacter sp. KR11 TaxID=2974588 RepID=UPI0022229798|nr:phosphoglycolate phosphatase [Rhodobacter sp. KR11]MCW1920344.1 phosphoglycolate phosphatase [Rhodobacter sp. KR11]